MAKPKESLKKYIFVSYSTRETHISLLLSLLWIVFSEEFDLRVTPSALRSGASQLDQICRLAKNCSFAVVVLDGLRPNVIFEYGLLRAFGRPIILLKEQNAVVDVEALLDESAKTVALNIDKHFSDVKDENYAEWYASEPQKTATLLWQEYRKKEKEIQGYVAIKEARLW